MATLVEALKTIGEEALRDSASSATEFGGLAASAVQYTSEGTINVGPVLTASLRAWRGLINPDTLLAGDFGGGGSGGGGAGSSFPGLPTEGGQCDAVPYIVGYRYTQVGGQITDSSVDALYGPIGPLERVVLSDGRVIIRIPSRGISPGPVQTYPTYFTINNSPAPGVTDEEYTTFTRKDGQPDDCGDAVQPPAELPPPTTRDLTFDGSDGNPITVPVETRPLAPTINANLDVVFPINISGPNLNVNVNVEPGCGLTCIGPADLLPTLLPPIIDLIDEITAENEVPVPYNQAITPAIIGVAIAMDTDPDDTEATQVFGQTGPPALFPDVGFVRFKERTTGNWSRPFQVQTAGQLILCPFETGASEVSLSPRLGIDWTVQELIGNVAIE